MPFHILITLSGVIILYGLYFGPTLDASYPGSDTSRSDIQTEINGISFGEQTGELSEVPIASLDAMAAEAEAIWGGESISGIYINGPTDVGGKVLLYKSLDKQVSSNDRRISFDPFTGEIQGEPKTTAGYETQQWVSGMHMIFFNHWVLRWLYFIGGAAGCVMIATGYIYWMEIRRKKYKTNKWPGVRIVEGFAVWGVMGLMTGTAAFFAVNRIVQPGNWIWNGIPKPFIEVLVFYLVWLAALFHGWIRGKAAWGEQAWWLGALCVAAVSLNWITTGDHLGASLLKGDLAIAGMDAMLLVTAGISITAARKIGAVRRAARTLEAKKLSRAIPAPAE